MMHLNCEALVTLAHLFLSQPEPGDALLNVSSTLAFAPVPNLSVYSATKAFVTSFSESLWYEHKDRGVYVMGLCPGMTATESQPHTGEDVPMRLGADPGAGRGSSPDRPTAPQAAHRHLPKEERALRHGSAQPAAQSRPQHAGQRPETQPRSAPPLTRSMDQCVSSHTAFRG